MKNVMDGMVRECNGRLSALDQNFDKVLKKKQVVFWWFLTLVSLFFCFVAIYIYSSPESVVLLGHLLYICEVLMIMYHVRFVSVDIIINHHKMWLH